MSLLIATLLSSILPVFSQINSQQDNNLLQTFSAQSKDDRQWTHLDSHLIVFETEKSYILKSPLTNFASYDYYYIQIPNDPHFLSWLSDSTQVVLSGDEFAIVRIDNENTVAEVASKVHDLGKFCGLIQKLSEEPIELTMSEPTPLWRAKDPKVEALLPSVNVDNILNTMNTMVSWKTRYESSTIGVETSTKLKALYEALVPSDRSDVTIEEITHSATQQKSLVVRILGQTQSDELVILGSHLDSINSNNKEDAPGADDNASGTSTNMEVFRVLMENKIAPQKTIEIQAYAAEEIGLVGSAEIATAYKNQGKKVVAMLQFDMNGYSKSGAAINFIENGTNSTLTQQMMGLAKDYLSIPVRSGHLLFGSSDHASWQKRGYPAAFPTEDPWAYNKAIHTKNDTMNQVNSSTQIHEFAKLGVAYLMHYAGY